MKRSLNFVLAAVVAGAASLTSAQIGPYGSAGFGSPPPSALNPYGTGMLSATALGSTGPLLFSPNPSAVPSSRSFGPVTSPPLGSYGSSMGLGSATPSLETLENAVQGRYVKHLLPQRPGTAQAPHMALVDLRRHASEQGLSQPAMQAIGRHLTAGGQVIVFLNRRGYAPSLFCNACGWVAPCAHCDARMTLHRRAAQLRCHHCGAHAPVPATCGSCGQPLNPVGQGTERVEETLARLFPDAPLARLDRDTATGRGAMEAVLERVHRGIRRSPLVRESRRIPAAEVRREIGVPEQERARG
jgi:predicted RNA-binding Zn-ribbon protein involved in translation (DUF1610 family)